MKISTKSVIAAAFICFGCANVTAQTQSVNETFGSAGNWIANQSTNSSYTISDGHLNCTMGNQGSSYRGDIWYNWGGDAGLNVTLDPAKDVYLAIKFIGNRPSGALKMEMNLAAGGWYNTQWNGGSGDGNITTYSNNKIYYFQLTKETAYTAATDISKIHFVIADATVEPFEYSVDWIATFTSLANLEAYKDTNEDGDTDADEGSVDPATLDGYMYYPFSSNTDGWVNSTSQKVFRNNNKLILENTATTSLQARRNGTPVNATNFPYLAIKVDALPAGFDQDNFHIQTNCSALSVFDSWYSVAEKKGDIYVFDMTSCVNKNTNEAQDAILTTNNADIWIDFGNIAAGGVAQIGWVKTFQTLGEITSEVADPLSPEASTTAGEVTYEFDSDQSGTWDWRTPHWQDGDNGCIVTAEGGFLTLTPNGQVGCYTRNPQALNTNNFPYLAFKISDIGDAGYFALAISSLTKGNYVKTNLDAAVVDTLVVVDALGASNNIIVFDLSSYLMFNTATDVQIRMDFYQGTSGTTSPSLPVKIDWIRSYASKEEITGTQTAIFTPETNKTFRYYSENGALYIFSDQVQNVAIYGIEGRLIKQQQLAAGKNQVSLPQGVYIVNKQKVLVK